MIKFKECTPQFCFFMFLLLLSWEGPLVIYFGAREGDFVIILCGFFLTIFLWLFFGLENFCAILSGRHKQNNHHINTDLK